jgi:hypothetical protein
MYKKVTESVRPPPGCSDNARTKMQSNCAIQRGLCSHRIKCSKWKVNCKIKRDKQFIDLFVTGNVSKLLFHDKNYEYIDSDVRFTRRTIIHP